ncbi:MAG: hypothetical protein JWM49_221 [Microbacteriaceae bacterium]|nr:hypothetical protein [Microbacteriaceae bacterium]
MTIHSPNVRELDDDGRTERTFNRVVHHGGRDFLATEVMASIFSARAQDVIARADTELVPLLHKDGVELLLIGPGTVFAVVNIGMGPGSHHVGGTRATQRGTKSMPSVASRD